MSSDSDKVQRGLNGDRGALQELVDEHFGPTFAMAYSLTGSVSDSEDLVQETFLRAFQDLSRFRKGADFGAWLAGILRRTVAYRKRRHARSRRAARLWAEKHAMKRFETPQDIVMKRETKEILDLTVERLPENLRLPLVLYYYENHSTSRVAKRLNLRPETVRKRVQRARDSLGHDLAAKLSSAVAFLEPPSHLKANILKDIPGNTSSTPATKQKRARQSKIRRAVKLSSFSHKAAVITSLLFAAATSTTAVFLLRSLSSTGSMVKEADVGFRKTEEAKSVEQEPAHASGDAPGGEDRGSAQSDTAQTIAPEERADVFGRVVSYNSKEPIAGARVVFLDDIKRASGEAVGEVSTDKSGWFRFKGPLDPKVKRVNISVSKAGYAAAFREGSLRGFNPRAGESPITIKLHRGILVQGRVLLEDGSPAREGSVWCYNNVLFTKEDSCYFSRDQSPGFEHIGSNGRFQMRAWSDRGLIAFLAKVPGYVPNFSKPVMLERNRKKGVVIRVKPGQSISGKVVDKSGKPASGAWVVASCDPEGQLQQPFTYNVQIDRIKTDAKGKFHLEGLPGSVNLTISHPEFLRKKVEYLQTRRKGVVFQLEAARWLTLKMQNGSGNRVTAKDVKLITFKKGRKRTLTTFFLEGDTWRSGPFDAMVSEGVLKVSDFVPVELNWPEGTGAYDLGAVKLERGLVLAVYVVDGDGEAVGQVETTLSSGLQNLTRNATTDSDGRVRIGGLTPGEYQISVKEKNFLYKEKKVVLEPLSEDKNREIFRTIVLEHGGSLGVEVVDSSGNLLEGAWIGIYNAESSEALIKGYTSNYPERLCTGRTDRTGCLMISGVKPNRPLFVRCHKNGFVNQLREVSALENGEKRDTGRYVLKRGITVRGVVQEENGAPVASANVTLTPEGDSEGAERPWWADDSSTCFSDNEGRFVISGLRPGIYAVEAESFSRIQKEKFSVSINIGDAKQIKIVMEQAAHYGVSVVYEDGRPVSLNDVDLDYVETYGFNPYGGGPDTEIRRFWSKGIFSLRNLPDRGPIDVRVSYGRLQKEFQFDSVYEIPREIVVPRGANLKLYTDVEGDREAPSPVRVRLQYDDRKRPSSFSLSSYRTDDMGEYELTDLRPGSAMLSLEGSKFLLPDPQPILMTSGEVTEVSFTLRAKEIKKETALLVVRDSVGAAVPEARVYKDCSGWRPKAIACTNTEGEARIKWSGEPPRRLKIEARGFAEKCIKGFSGKAQGGEMEIFLRPESVIEVEVIEENGEPVPAAYSSINLKTKTGLSSTLGQSKEVLNGYVCFNSLKAGEYRLGFYTERDSDGKGLGTVDVRIGTGERRELTFAVPTAFEVYGKVLHNGKLLTTGSLDFLGYGATPDASINGKGGYHMRLFVTGKYSIWLHGRDKYGDFDRMIDVELNGSRKLDIEVNTVFVEGCVIDENGSPVKGVTVRLSGPETYKDRSRKEGKFTFTHINPGKYNWNVYKWYKKEGTDDSSVLELGRGEVNFENLEEEGDLVLEVTRKDPPKSGENGN